METLKLDEEHAIFPEDGDCFAAIGAALCAGDFRSMPFDEALRLLEESREATTSINTAPQLFRDEAEYKAFCERHNASHPPEADPGHLHRGRLSGHRRGQHHHQAGAHRPGRRAAVHLLRTPTRATRSPLSGSSWRKSTPSAATGSQIRGSAVTGYGEDLILNAFRCDLGLVETVAHLTRRPALQPRRGLHHRHRRPGHEVLQDPQRRRGLHHAQRGLLLGLRLLYRDLCPGPGL